MKIGIDTDGVLTDMSGFLLDLGKQYLKRNPAEPQAYGVEEMFQTSKWEKMRYGIQFFLDYCKKCPPREGAQKVIAQLNKDGYETCEITARKFVTMKNPLGYYSKKMLLNWYKAHRFNFSKIVFCSEKNTGAEKLKACLDFGATVMVEDRPEVATTLAESGITVLLFDAPYNQDLYGEQIIRCYTWNDVYDQITQRIKAN